MYRLMIADDEDDERMGIRYLLNKYDFSFEIIEASDGKDALEKLKEYSVDILLTDVKMPFLNGLQLSEMAKEISPEIQIVFFSGYDDFDYVKRALSLRAVDYILKPVNPMEFQKVIRLVLERMDKEEQLKKQTQQFQEMFILTRLLNQVPFEKLQREYREDELSFLRQYTRMILMEFEQEFFGKAVEDIQELERKIMQITGSLNRLLDMNPFQAVLFLEQDDRKREEDRKIAQNIHRMIEADYHIQCYLAISPEYLSPGLIGNMFSEAEGYLEDRFYYRDEFVYPVDEVIKKDDRPEGADHILQTIEKDINFADVDGLKRDMEILMKKCRNNGFQSYIYTRFVCASLLELLYQGLPEESQQLAASVEKIYACSRFQDIEIMIQGIMDRLEKKLTAAQDSPKHVTAIVEQYIHEHYMDTLSLDILADKVYLTPHYLSSIFSQEKKVGISKYIKNIRMQNAEKLLGSTNMKIQDICRAVGYSNLSYFCRTFRNEYGVTPEKYRER